MNSQKMQHAYQNANIKTKELVKSSRLNVREDEIELPDGSERLFHVVTHPGASAIIPIAEDGKVILVKQYRHACEQVLLEIPAGLIEDGEDPQTCARRELQEEVGVDAKAITPLFSIHTAPGFTNEVIHLFLAKGLFDSPLIGEDSDEIDCIHLSLEESLKMIGEGKITDAKTVIGLYFLQHNNCV